MIESDGRGQRSAPQEAGRRIRTLVAARSLADREGVSVESIDADEALARGPVAAQLTERLERVLAPEARAPEDVAEPAQYRRALSSLLKAAQRTGQKLDHDPLAPLSRVETAVLEAVVRTDGSRPSLLVRNDTVDADHPTAGDWAQTFRDTGQALRPAIAAVGRVEPDNATSRDYFGTCWVTDQAAGLALTNLHVVEAMWRRLPFQMERTEHGFRIRGGAFVEFVAESGSQRSNRARVVEALVTDIDGPGYRRLDAAVLKLEPVGDGMLPAALPVLADPDGPAGSLFSFCIVGFPGAPAYAGGTHEGVDWTWVNATVFGNRYGVKRLAPGTVHRPLGSFDGDSRRWVFGHDATTLGGSSGSPLLSWLDPKVGGFGLHFAGLSVDTNVAHAVVACAAELRTLGIQAREPDL